MSGTTLEKFAYDNKIVKYFGVATIAWGLIGMLVGVIAATQLFLPEANMGNPYTTYGRIRPLHTNAVIFAFVGNAIFAGIYYSMPRLLKAPMWSKALSWINFWGWQFIILLAVITLPLGLTSSKEYAELEWPIDILIALVWVAFGANMIGTLIKRREKHMYVAIWFYLASFVTVAVLHIFNSLALPVSFFKSYSAYAGVQDALVQWWYGHNAVAFFLTTPFLGLMYYYLPKAANRPVYSYKLSIIHFWSLIFLYIWAGPHHLLYTALPEWAQILGVVFSVMLIAPSWGGMVNGLLTLRGAWDKVRVDPVLKFMVVAVTAYGMATFEGPLLSLKSVNAIAHYTDWIVAHVHIGALGWNGFFTFAMLYWLWPKMWKTTLYSNKLANTHFWMGTIGILFYALPMYVAALTQSLMWKEFTEAGRLAYPNFLETVIQIVPMYILRAFGGLLYLSGAFLMVYNMVKTAKQGKFMEEEADEAPALEAHVSEKGEFWHRAWERKPVFFTILATIAIAIGGAVEIIPTILVKSNVPTISSVTPYSALELQGRDLYISHGCVGCHSQMIRPFRSETERYGEYSKAGEFVYDRPFLWGSKRTGPDLHRVGGKYPDSWHYHHMVDPRSMSPGSLMPPYPWMATSTMDHKDLPAKIRTLQKLGVPYPEGYDAQANADLELQANQIVANLKDSGIEVMPDTEIVALIAYLQRLGTDIKKTTATNP
ncbi:MAG: cytochrome-c oxidase, cbb3-type subunit I [Mongoliibacter sp.]|uniref:cytochrome-c oxidase, cbb3-type subunit I n=1 Tax=Mongoliibacter sp. TaxID=2022438 RepID=UPI0012F1891E|nr:cytochrome-c oxidase, cbb3-type subunit I [Mongoliibacter sp.]TVP50998.1 MAG: cytochrome-c oxidase, cbb3-type subunit I [Mongoliibacter sp.]